MKLIHLSDRFRKAAKIIQSSGNLFFICFSFNCCLLPLSIISFLLREIRKIGFFEYFHTCFMLLIYLFTFTPLIKVKQAFFVEL